MCDFQMDCFPAWTQFSFLSGESLQKWPLSHCLLQIKDTFHGGAENFSGTHLGNLLLAESVRGPTEAVTEPHLLL